MCFMCPAESKVPKLFNITGVPLTRPKGSSSLLPPPPPAAARHSAAIPSEGGTKPPSARYSAFKALKAQRKAAAQPEPEPEP